MSGSVVNMAAASASAPFRPWAELDAGLVSSIAACCTLRDYASCRAVCGAWRSTLLPPLLRPLAVLPADDDAGHPVSLAACSHHARRWARLLDLHRPTGPMGGCRCRCVGASRDGWLALVAGDAEAPAGPPLLFNPFTGEEIPLDPGLYEAAHEPAPKIVFSANPSRQEFTAVSLCRPNRVAVQRRASAGGRSRVDDTGPLVDRDVVLVDVAYSDDHGKVYCLAKDGQVIVLHLNHGCRRRRVPPMEVGPLPKLPLGTVLFPSPYDAISKVTDAKNLVLCDGVLNQVWRRPTGAGNAAVDVEAPEGGVRRWIHIFEGDVFVLRFDPRNSPSGPCWSVVEAKDLRGNALFVGLNDAAVVRGEGVSANSVYYWDGPRGGDYEAVVYSMTTRTSIGRWPAVSTGGMSSPVWYFLPAGETQRVEAEATDEVEATSGEANSPELDEEEPDHSAHCLKKTMSLLGRLDYSPVYYPTPALIV